MVIGPVRVLGLGTAVRVLGAGTTIWVFGSRTAAPRALSMLEVGGCIVVAVLVDVLLVSAAHAEISMHIMLAFADTP
jgi:hypothetical protein